MQVTVESCTSVCVNTLQKTLKKMIDRDYPEASKDDVYNYTLDELKKFSVNGQYFEYTAQSNHLGGHRWFFLCPKCGKRANKLLLPPPGSKNKENRYLCKVCYKLKNQSALMGQNQIYRKVTRPLKRLKEIEDKISHGHLKTDKVQALLNEYEMIEKHLKASPEFRLYSFKKVHNL